MLNKSFLQQKRQEVSFHEKKFPCDIYEIFCVMLRSMSEYEYE